MMEAVRYIWHEESEAEGWSIGLTERGEVSLFLAARQSWEARSQSLRLNLPVGVVDALVKHKGETRRYLGDLSNLSSRGA